MPAEEAGSAPPAGRGETGVSAGKPGELAPVSIMAEPADPADSANPAEAAAARSRASRRSQAPEQDVAIDMLKRSVFFAVPLAAAAALGWGWPGLASAGLALTLVLVNLMLGAMVITLGAGLGGNALMAAVLGGYALRLGIIAVAVLPVVRHHWFEIAPFAVSLLVTHIGLLAAECRHVSLSAAYPGLKPSPRGGSPLSGKNSRPAACDSLALESRERTLLP